ncbi:MAG TPA: rhomboid family intramembrane serine protease [Bacteroidales bacterium]|nr:rhomboid family intramembrane serine protease [Bacteroidales bacterium]
MLRELRQFFNKSPLLVLFIGINLVVFLLINFLRLIFFLWDMPHHADVMTAWIGISSNPGLIVSRPWTAFTYMFLHFGFFHIFFNMLVLYVGGRLFSDFIGNKQLSVTYLLGGLTGALFFVLAYNFFPVFEEVKHQAVAIGASASVLAIFIAVTVYAPDYRLPLILLGPVKLKYIAIFFVIIDILSIERGNPGGHIAHLGGAFWGLIYGLMVRARIDPAKKIGLWVGSIARRFSPKSRLKVKYSSTRPLTDEDYNFQRSERQKEIDRILDKISHSGYESLSAKEKEMLFKMGNKP